MSERKKVFITVNPDLIAGKRMQTVRSMVTALDKHADLFLVPIDELDFRSGKFQSYRRMRGGWFRKHSKPASEADLWINYTDGYYLNYRDFGYKKRRDFLEAQFRFYENLDAQVINTAEAERRTLKDWFARLNCEKLGIIPTYLFNSRAELEALLQKHKRIVVKPNWGGASEGVHKIDSKESLRNFLRTMEDEGETFKDYSCQLYREGGEKRLWFAGNEFVGGRICFGRKTPWSACRDDYNGKAYDCGAQFQRDLKIAQHVWKLSGLQVGCVDFIGNEINEINGCGTTYVFYQGWTKLADARKPLVDYLITLL